MNGCCLQVLGIGHSSSRAPLRCASLGSASLSPECEISLPVASATGRRRLKQFQKPGGRHMCRPPGLNSKQKRVRWLTPPAGMCRPPGLNSKQIRVRWLTPPAEMCRPPGAESNFKKRSHPAGATYIVHSCSLYRSNYRSKLKLFSSPFTTDLAKPDCAGSAYLAGIVSVSTLAILPPAAAPIILP